jgi:predicted ABC-type ATPase
MENVNMQSEAIRKPEIIVFAGPNGSGKSTITTPEWIKGPYINADDIKREQGVNDIEAANIADQLRYDLIAKGETFSFETVLSTERKLNMLRDAKENGYFIRGYFVMTCDPELNVQRVHARVQSGGHPVDDATVRRRYRKALANIPEFVSICDVCHIYDNTVEPFRIIRKHKNDISFYTNAFWPEDTVQALLLDNPYRLNK